MEISLSPLEGRDGLLVTSIIRDITERERVQEAMRQSETSFRLLFANNPQPMWVYELETLRFLDAIVQHGVVESGVALLQKPFTPDALPRKVREVLDAARRDSA